MGWFDWLLGTEEERRILQNQYAKYQEEKNKELYGKGGKRRKTRRQKKLRKTRKMKKL